MVVFTLAMPRHISGHHTFHGVLSRIRTKSIFAKLGRHSPTKLELLTVKTVLKRIQNIWNAFQFQVWWRAEHNSNVHARWKRCGQWCEEVRSSQVLPRWQRHVPQLWPSHLSLQNTGNMSSLFYIVSDFQLAFHEQKSKYQKRVKFKHQSATRAHTSMTGSKLPSNSLSW